MSGRRAALHPTEEPLVSRSGSFRRAAAAALSALCALALAAPAGAQRDSATVVAGPGYEADALHSFLLGSKYRDLWTTPIRVPSL